MVYLRLILLLVCTVAGAQSVDNTNNKDLPKPKEFSALNPEMRLKLWELSKLPPDQLKQALSLWPRFQKMPPEKQDQLMERMQEMKGRLHDLAMNKAKEYGLAISPDQEDTYADKYIQRRLEEEKKIWDEMKPLQEKMEALLKDEMVKEFGTTKP